MTSVFADITTTAYPHRFHGTLHVSVIAGGTPTDPKKAEGHIRSKMFAPDDIIRDLVSTAMVERGVTADEAAEAVAMDKNLNGFRRDQEHGLYIEGRQLKAAIKEAANVRWPKERWGPSKKGTRSFFAEHVFVPETRLYLGVQAADDIIQRFVHTWRGDAIQYEEVVYDAKIDFSVITDHPFKREEWALLWLTGEQQGIGASRSQGYGRYEVVRWEAAA